MFLVGKGIPEEITSLPETVLNTPFGQMLRPSLERTMRDVTQAPVPQEAVPRQNAHAMLSSGESSSLGGKTNGVQPTSDGLVHNITKLQELDRILSSAKNSCAVIFFTASTCPPCKIVYPAYDALAAELAGKATLIKVDINQAYEIGSRYQVRATPTFMTFLLGEKENEWSGANAGQLQGNVRLLVQMAHPPHPHLSLKLANFQRPHGKPIIFTKLPPLAKLLAKLGPLQNDPAVNALKTFVTNSQSCGPADNPVPSLPSISTFLIHAVKTVDPPSLFPIIDLFRLALVDPRISSYYAEEPSHLTIHTILSSVSALKSECPYPLRITTLQLSCNLFSSSLFPPQLLNNPALSTPILNLLTSSLLDPRFPALRISAASTAYNLVASNHHARPELTPDLLPEHAQVELMAALLEALRTGAVSQEGGMTKDEVRVLLLTVGLLAYAAPAEGELVDLCTALDAKGVLGKVKKLDVVEKEREIGKVVEEVEALLG